MNEYMNELETNLVSKALIPRRGSVGEERTLVVPGDPRMDEDFRHRDAQFRIRFNQLMKKIATVYGKRTKTLESEPLSEPESVSESDSVSESVSEADSLSGSVSESDSVSEFESVSEFDSVVSFTVPRNTAKAFCV